MNDLITPTYKAIQIISIIITINNIIINNIKVDCL